MQQNQRKFHILSLVFCFLASMKLQVLSIQHTNKIPNSNRERSIQSVSKISTILSKVVVGVGIGFLPLISSSQSAQAKTYFDITVYGDKELKIATVNKLKQKLRNAILLDTALAPAFLKLSINDALGFDMNSLDGGSDGSISYELNRPENAGLEKAMATINQVKKELQRTNTVSLSDVIAFAGSEALEAVGSNRIVVQVGRFDTNKENRKTSLVPWNDLTNIAAVKEAFLSSGLDTKDIAVLLGALGETERIIDESNAEKLNDKSKNRDRNNEDDEEDESSSSLDEEPFVPVTFGARDAIYGAKVGKNDFGTTYFTNILKNKNAISNSNSVAAVLLGDPQVKTYVQKYDGNNVAFTKDLSDSYLKLTSVGKEFTNRNS